jgi:hypothetical protein
MHGTVRVVLPPPPDDELGLGLMGQCGIIQSVVHLIYSAANQCGQ